MHIDEMIPTLLSADATAARFACQASDDWAQGRTLFGGVQAMLAVRAMRQWLPTLPPLWSLHSTFVAPIAPGHMLIEVSLLRQGKTAVQLSARLLDGEQTAAIFVAAFGQARDSAVQLSPPARPVGVVAEPAGELPYMPGITPAFTQHYGYRWLAGALPFSGGKAPFNRIRLRQRDAGVLDEAHIVAMADAIPPVALSLLPGPTPASTLSWSLEFVRHQPPLDAEDWWHMDATLLAARDGYCNQDAHLYGPDGELVVLSRQVVTVFG
ncbi:acyl-CoA thioesterase [Aquitalea magnusonii]|uniref:Acyl-CoA thioesterase n=1 Tax=Aquitalea magnusonii TaxID=332411 RepID=A0A318IUH6_9NEIS|nr:thioesterase family protein [Aquitalea magnusonii]PXX38844.1 acyl-CoA thioesterase [Aquitalea magnusonii]